MLLAPVRWALRIVAVVVAVIVGYFAVTLLQVWLTGRHYDAHPASAIVVMGAAQYDCVPSPDLRARLDQAATLYHQGLSRLIVVTGGKEPRDTCTEAQSGAKYLEEMKGVPASAILEAGGNDSWQNVADARPELDARGATTVLMVTDPFHEARSMAIASSQGLSPSGTPTQTSPISGWAAFPFYMKEALGVGLGRIIGFNHLEWLHQA